MKKYIYKLGNFILLLGKFILYNIVFFSFVYVGLNSHIIYNDLFGDYNIDKNINNENEGIEKKEDNSPQFLLFDSKKNKDYLSFPGKKELELFNTLLKTISTTENSEEVKQEIKQEVKQETKQEIKKEVKQEIKKEAKQEIKKEIKQEIYNKKIIKNDFNGGRDILNLTTELNQNEWHKYGEKPWLKIPSLKIEAPIIFHSIEEHDLEKVILKSLENGVVHRPETQRPDQEGNFFLVGHSSNYPWIKSKYNNIFSKIPKLKIGDIAYVYYQGRKFEYQLYSKFVVPPTATDVYGFIPGYNMTLMTCYPIGTDKNRMILRFKLIN